MSSEPRLKVYQLPYQTRKHLVDELDTKNDWKDLGGMYVGLNDGELARMNRDESPSSKLLSKMDSLDWSVQKLFICLSKLRLYRAMNTIKSYVDSEYHKLIPKEFMLEELDVANNILTKQNREIDLDVRSAVPKTNLKLNNETTERKVSESEAEKQESIPFIPYEELTKITNNWDISRKLGQGGFGVVFKGVWKQTEIAIKRLEPLKKNEESFTPTMQMSLSLKELKHINMCRHENILPLYGHSIHDNKYILVFPYMPKGSLDQWLYKSGTDILSWRIRFNIAKGTAKGLQFLHSMEPPIIHADIKSANILLDENFKPLIGDFGLARDGPKSSRTHTKISRVYGTRPYLPHEFLSQKKISKKVDTYSFGVLLFELATGLKPYSEERSEKILREYIYGYDGNYLYDLYPRSLGEFKIFAPVFMFLIDLGKKCCRFEARERPLMDTIFEELHKYDTRSTIDNTQSNRTIKKFSDYIGPNNPYHRPSMLLPPVGSSITPGTLNPHSIPPPGSRYDQRSPSPSAGSRIPKILVQVPEINSHDQRLPSENKQGTPKLSVMEQGSPVPNRKLTSNINNGSGANSNKNDCPTLDSENSESTLPSTQVDTGSIPVRETSLDQPQNYRHSQNPNGSVGNTRSDIPPVVPDLPNISVFFQ